MPIVNLLHVAFHCLAFLLPPRKGKEGQRSGKAKICKNQQKSANKKTANLAPFVPFSLSLVVPLDSCDSNIVARRCSKDPAVPKILHVVNLLRVLNFFLYCDLLSCHSLSGHHLPRFYRHSSSQRRVHTSLDVPIRGAQSATDRIVAIRSDLKSHDSNRNPNFRSIRCDVFTFFSKVQVFSNRAIRFTRFGSLADPDSNRAHRDI